MGGVHPRANPFWSLNGGVTLPIAVRGWNSHYNLDTLVDAPPYGTTRIYRRAASVGSGVPLVSAYVPEEKRWLKQLGAPIKSDVHEVSPLQLSMQLGSNQLRYVQNTRKPFLLVPGSTSLAYKLLEQPRKSPGKALALLQQPQLQ
jgi:hypothetical protein